MDIKLELKAILKELFTNAAEEQTQEVILCHNLHLEKTHTDVWQFYSWKGNVKFIYAQTP